MTGLDVDKQADIVFDECRRLVIPPPSVIVFSGRGLQVKWFFVNPLPRRALPRWNAVQKMICKQLAHLGADPKSRDASRVLRLENTINTKSGKKVRILYETPGERWDDPVRYDFDMFADAILPYSMAEIKSFRQKAMEDLEKINRVKANKESCRPTSTLWQAPKRRYLKRFDAEQLQWDRFEDIRLLIRIREWQETGTPEGFRDIFMFHAVNCLSWCIDAKKLFAEICEIGREFAGNLTDSEIRSYSSTVLQRSRRAAAGETILFNGRHVDPRYRYTNQKLIDDLEITPAEERRLHTIISVRERKVRDVERTTKNRRAAGVITRAEYLSQFPDKSPCLVLLKQGMSEREIAVKLGISRTTVNKFLFKVKRHMGYPLGSSDPTI